MKKQFIVFVGILLVLAGAILEGFHDTLLVVGFDNTPSAIVSILIGLGLIIAAVLTDSDNG